MKEKLRPIRRVVTGNDARGRSRVLFDSAAPNVNPGAVSASAAELRSRPGRFGRAPARAEAKTGRHLGPRRAERLQLARPQVGDGGLWHSPRRRARAAPGRRRARDETGRRRRAARQLARLDQPEEREPDGLRHDGREARRMKVKPVRRIVCVDGPDGKSKAIEDGPAPDVHTDPARPGFSSTLIWATDSTPARIDCASERVRLPNLLSPPPTMQKTRTLDFCLVLEGEITLVLDTEEVHLKAGDTVVQRGTHHAWSNRSIRPCVVAISSHDAI